MTGCWQPLHSCIDNAIHTFAGVQLRLECAQAMAEQGHPEPTGYARITQAYNLPCQRIIHTVGPIAQGFPSDAQSQQLAQCYNACLDAALASRLSQYCILLYLYGRFWIPTGQSSSYCRYDGLSQWLADHPQSNMTVVFDVFLDEDRQLYSNLLGIR